MGITSGATANSITRLPQRPLKEQEENQRIAEELIEAIKKRINDLKYQGK